MAVFLPAILLSCLFAACAGPMPLRDSRNPGASMGRTDDPLYSSIHEFHATTNKNGPKFTMSFIEFTEQGGLAAPEQFVAAATNLSAWATNSTPILLFYLHGWRNNSRSQDVMEFCEFSAHLARCLHRMENHSHLFCVYLAWDGSYFSEDRHPDYSAYLENNLPPKGTVNNLSIHDTQIGTLFDLGTFWSRKAAAENVASLELIEVLTGLADLAHANPEGRAIALAHSFGALILERTLAQALPAMVHDEKLVLPFDLTVLMNPAAEGFTAYRIIDFFKRRITDCAAQAERPAIITVNAMNDIATRYAFTAGTIPKRLGLWLPWNRFLNNPILPWATHPDKKSVRSAELLTCTSGHSRYLPSHDLRFERELPRAEAGYREKLGNMGFDARGSGTNAWIFAVNFAANMTEPHLYSPTNHEAVLWQNPRAGDDRVASVWQCVGLKPKAHSGAVKEIYNRTPYWILRVPPEVISGHGGIWSPNSKSLLTALYRMSGRFGETSRRVFDVTSVSAMRDPRAEGGPTGGLVDVEEFQSTTNGASIPEPALAAGQDRRRDHVDPSPILAGSRSRPNGSIARGRKP